LPNRSRQVFDMAPIALVWLCIEGRTQRHQPRKNVAVAASGVL
jgi:hypothetical protein